MLVKGKARITIDDEPAIAEKLDELARNEGLSRSDIVRRALRVFLMSNSSINATNPLMVQSPDHPTTN